MQAAKILVGQLYALKFPNKLGPRFRVTAVETTQRRSRQGKADSTSWIEGVINPEDIPAELLPQDETERKDFLQRRVPPESITGTYEQHEELVARETAAQAATKAKEQRCREQAQALRAVFYQLSGLPMPEADAGPARGQ